MANKKISDPVYSWENIVELFFISSSASKSEQRRNSETISDCEGQMSNPGQQHWAFWIASHEMQPAVTNLALLPISHPILSQWLEKQADISSSRSLMLPLQPTRRGGSDTEQWASLQEDARILQQSLTAGGKLQNVREWA